MRLLNTLIRIQQYRINDEAACKRKILGEGITWCRRRDTLELSERHTKWNNVGIRQDIIECRHQAELTASQILFTSNIAWRSWVSMQVMYDDA
jgi:hypothetical protein